MTVTIGGMAFGVFLFSLGVCFGVAVGTLSGRLSAIEERENPTIAPYDPGP